MYEQEKERVFPSGLTMSTSKFGFDFISGASYKILLLKAI
jgi:hypothetical protein